MLKDHSNKNSYKIKPRISSNWLQYNRLINAEYSYKIIDNLNYKDIIPQKGYPYYSIISEGEWENQGITQYENYFIEDISIRELNKDEIPIEGYVLWVFGNEQKNMNSYGSIVNRFYIFK